MLWPVGIFFAFLEVRRQSRYCLWEANSVFYMKMFGLVWQSVNLLWKNSSLEMLFVFSPIFLADTKITFVCSSFKYISKYRCLIKELFCIWIWWKICCFANAPSFESIYLMTNTELLLVGSVAVFDPHKISMWKVH